MDALRAILGAPPVPEGSWERDAVYVSTAALRRAGGPAREVAEGLAARLRAVPGVRTVEARPNGFLVIEVATPGEIVPEILAEPPRPAPAPQGGRAAPWPDRPRTWSNPGFVVRYAYVRAGAVQRWARDLGIGVPLGFGAGLPEPPPGKPGEGLGAPGGGLGEPENGWGFRAGLLDGPRDRAVLRVLAELPSRRAGRDSGRPAYLERLAEAYHDAFEHAPAIPKGDETPTGTHVARLCMARAVRKVLGEGLAELGQTPPVKI
ncbi:anticodon-binding protein [Sphaerisporangium dianthi]|uniref:Anticodon-binding protein n=1 Tax=Sphaerisporangium dianthi TaxID=1436120 RepID=A0ABV9CPK6_9ACTN